MVPTPRDGVVGLESRAIADLKDDVQIRGVASGWHPGLVQLFHIGIVSQLLPEGFEFAARRTSIFLRFTTGGGDRHRVLGSLVLDPLDIRGQPQAGRRIGLREITGARSTRKPGGSLPGGAKGLQGSARTLAALPRPYRYGPRGGIDHAVGPSLT